MSIEQMRHFTNILRESPLDLGGDAVTMRAIYREMLRARPLASDVRSLWTDLGGVAAFQVTTSDEDPIGTILHFHGGCYAIGGADTSVNLMADVSRRTSTRVISLDYRLAPEHPYPAATDDALTAYRALLESGVAASSIAFVGESAGAGLAMATLLGARDTGLPQPSSGVLLSPWVDLTQSGESLSTKADVDPSMTGTALRIRAESYLGDVDPRGAYASPIFANLHGVAPLLIQVGSHEVLLDDAVRLAAKAATNDVNVILDVVAGGFHMFQAFAAALEEGAAALDRVGTFLHTHFGDVA
jgi:monoterpene epsilon-lactone hydrolase